MYTCIKFTLHADQGPFWNYYWTAEMCILLDMPRYTSQLIYIATEEHAQWRVPSVVYKQMCVPVCCACAYLKGMYTYMHNNYTQ